MARGGVEVSCMSTLSTLSTAPLALMPFATHSHIHTHNVHVTGTRGPVCVRDVCVQGVQGSVTGPYFLGRISTSCAIFVPRVSPRFLGPGHRTKGKKPAIFYCHDVICVLTLVCCDLHDPYSLGIAQSRPGTRGASILLYIFEPSRLAPFPWHHSPSSHRESDHGKGWLRRSLGDARRARCGDLGVGRYAQSAVACGYP